MRDLASTSLRRRLFTGKGRLARILRGTLYAKLALVVLLTLGTGLLYLRLSAGPLSFGRLPERVAASLASRIGPGWSVTLRNTALQLENGSPALRAMGLDIRNPDGAVVLRAPFAILSVGGMSLLTANFQPRSIEFRDLQLRASLEPDGTLSFVPGQEVLGGEGDPVAVPAPPPVGAPKVGGGPVDASPVSVAVGSLFDLIVGPNGMVGSLDRARITNARLTVVGADHRERATFEKVDASFERTETGGRKFDATFSGPSGSWTITGVASADGQGGYTAEMVATDAPVRDLLLLSGLSGIPATSDLRLSGRVDAAFGDGKIKDLEARLSSAKGTIQIEDPDTSPFAVDTLALETAWDEARRTLVLKTLHLKGGATDMRLEGELASPAGEPTWRAVLRSRNAVLSGAAESDKPVRIDQAEARLNGTDGVTIEALAIRGPALSVDLSGVLASPQDPKGLRLDVRSTNSDVRHALRLWPEAVASKVRRFLVANLKAGTLERFGLKVAMTGADMEAALGEGPIPEESVRLDFAIADTVFTATDGLPPLSQAPVTGTVGGRKVRVRAPNAVVDMGEGRVLQASDGSFAIDDYWRKDAIAPIAFRLQGGADALGALLLSPVIRQIAAIDLDPANLKGRADLKVAIPLAVRNIPAFVDLPLNVQGGVAELVVDKAFGKERLDIPALAIAYDQGNLAIKGEGKLAGLPATVDARQTREAGGEAVIAFVLDDAARARKGFGFGPQLTGPLPIKAALPLGRNPREGIRVEADFAKAAVDGLVPGWTKPAGRPGKLVFTLVEGPVSEIRDLQLDSGTVQLRGNAQLAADGGIEKADLTTFKLSNGDDMRAQVERVNGTHRVIVRGNVGDARPFAKGFGAAPTNGRSASAKDAGRDFDLDVGLNILTGHNSEAITNAVIKASVRKDTIRQLDVKGRLGSSNVMAQTVPRAGGNPVIVAQAEDAGGFLRFLDVYRRMEGGDLVVQLATGEGPQAGFLTLHNFMVRNEPALRRILPTQTQTVSGTDANGRPQNVRIDVNQVAFTKARVDFTRTAGRIDFSDAAIWGQAIGFTLSGYLDYARDRTDITGTFVPAYGLNNAFAQVPLFGPLLGGGQYEGLFAVNFRLTGQASTPSLAVNPLSAVAPGFLRKLFGVGSAAEEPTGSVPRPPGSVGN
jgi:hypothetical protein